MNRTPSNYQAVFFDFDGVIADSTSVKVRAFTTLFAAYGAEIQEAVVRYHLSNGGMPRHEKIRHCFATFAKRILSEEELALAGTTFSSLVMEEVVAAPLMPGALDTLQLMQRDNIPAFVISGTPADEMQVIVGRKGLADLFKEVHGSPQTKPVIIEDILVRYGFEPQCCLFIGDALADYRAAMATGLRFLGIVPDGTSSIFPGSVPTSPIVRLPVMDENTESLRLCSTHPPKGSA